MPPGPSGARKKNNDRCATTTAKYYAHLPITCDIDSARCPSAIWCRARISRGTGTPPATGDTRLRETVRCGARTCFPTAVIGYIYIRITISYALQCTTRIVNTNTNFVLFWFFFSFFPPSPHRMIITHTSIVYIYIYLYSIYVIHTGWASSIFDSTRWCWHRLAQIPDRWHVRGGKKYLTNL